MTGFVPSVAPADLAETETILHARVTGISHEPIQHSGRWAFLEALAGEWLAHAGDPLGWRAVDPAADAYVTFSSGWFLRASAAGRYLLPRTPL